MPREPGSHRRWIKATDDDLSKAIRVEASDARGVCKCVTCDYRGIWNDGKIHAGHFIGKPESIRYVEMGIHPQCAACNTTGMTTSFHHTRKRTETVAHAYLYYMQDRYGEKAIDALRRLKSESKTWTVEELRVMRFWYKWRFKIAKAARDIP